MYAAGNFSEGNESPAVTGRAAREMDVSSQTNTTSIKLFDMALNEWVVGMEICFY